jgi:hypothetical protein
MSMAKNWATGFWRAAALAAVAVVLPACGDKSSVTAGIPGTGSNTPLNWYDTSLGAPVGTPGDTPLIWNDPNNAQAGGAFGIPSTDERTYGFPDDYYPGVDPRDVHPLMTNTSATAITTPETTVWSQMYNYRLGQNGGVGGVGGIGGIGGVGGGQTTTTPLRDSKALRKMARAHGKHYAMFHAPGFALVNAAENGDAINGGGVAPNGRIAKCELMVTAPIVESIVSGAAYGTANAAYQYFLGANGAVILNNAYTVVGVGHWRAGAGTDEYYWSAIFAGNAPIQ